jgi:hypothetical protein
MVSLDLPSGPSSGPTVFQVADVPVGDGPELTSADRVSNPSGWKGSVTVSVNNSDHTITIATEDSELFETAAVMVTSVDLGTVSLVSDNLWSPKLLNALAQDKQLDRATTTLPATMPLTLNSDPGSGWGHHRFPTGRPRPKRVGLGRPKPGTKTDVKQGARMPGFGGLPSAHLGRRA